MDFKVKYTTIQAQYNDHFGKIDFMRYKQLPGHLLGRIIIIIDAYNFGEVIYPEVKKTISVSDYFHIVYEGHVEITRRDKEILTVAIYEHVQKCIINREKYVNQQIDVLKRMKKDATTNEDFKKVILNKKLKKLNGKL